MRRRGFTLIELLVVIAIIAILAAILFPVFVNAKERARQSRCCSNLKQLTQAMFSYADDHDGYLPICSRRHMYQYGKDANGGANPVTVEWTGTQWTQYGTPPQAIDPKQGSLYMGGYARSVAIFNCSTDQDLPAWYSGTRIGWKFTTNRADDKTHDRNGLPGGLGITYSVNTDLADKFPPNNCKTIKLSAASAGRASQILFLIHESRGNSANMGQNDGIFVWTPVGGSSDIQDKIHYEGTTCSYADGHVKWLANKEMDRCRNANPSPWWRNAHFYDPTPSDNSWQAYD